jgi:hypothetical protein
MKEGCIKARRRQQLEEAGRKEEESSLTISGSISEDVSSA